MLFLGLTTTARAASVNVVYRQSTPQAAYAARKLRTALLERGFTAASERGGRDHEVVLSVDPAHLKPEEFAIDPRGKVIAIRGGDNRGMIYGALALVEMLRNGTRLEDVEATDQKAGLPFRAIKYNLPWSTYRPSTALSQHYDTARDLKYWEAFLDMMVENRFNAITLWNLDPFTYMVRTKHFPEASPWSDAQLAQWQHLYHEIFRMAKERGLDTYIVFWSIFVSRQLAEAHGVAKENFYPHYYGSGDTSEIVRKYLRESVTQTLQEYPDLDGIGVSQGEGMGGMTPQERQQWVDDVLIDGMLAAKRPAKLIYRAPFSSGTSSEPGVSTNVEQLTRAAIEHLDNRLEAPIWVEVKFNWSHGHSTTKLVKVHGGALGDTYFKPKPKNYRIAWTVRNEDFFALRWGVPDFIRQHIAVNGAQDYVGGYFIGSETFIPALDYFTAVQSPVDWKWAFQRQWLFYELWGRLLYDPKTPDTVFQADFTRRYGPKAAPLLKAYSLASATQLRLASLYDSTWDFTLYAEGFLALQGESMSYISIDRLISQPTMDPAYVSVGEYVAAESKGAASFGPERVTPPLLVSMLERDNNEALHLVNDIDPSGDASLMYEVADVKVWANLGLHLAEKLQGALALQTYRLHGGEENKRAAIEHLQRALEYWDTVVKITRPIYRDMPLTHYNRNSRDANDDNLFHWALIRDQVAADVASARDSRAPVVVASAVHADCEIKNVTAIPVETTGHQLLTRGTINGQPIHVLIDTGSYMSMVWRPSVERLGLRLVSGPRMRMFGLGGESPVDSTFVDELRIETFITRNVRLPVAGDLPSGVDFILGENDLSRNSVEFDLRHNVVRTMQISGCTPAQLPYWAKTYSMADLLASPADAQAIRVNVTLNGHPVRAQIDSGSSVSLLNKSIADAAHVPYASAKSEIVGIGQRTLPTWIGEVRSFKLGDESIDDTQLRVAQLGKYQTVQPLGSRIPGAAVPEPGLLLGLDFLRAHRVLIDNTTRKMVFTYEGGPVFQITRPAEPDANPSGSATSGN
jgi:predicted aspartyl protease